MLCVHRLNEIYVTQMQVASLSWNYTGSLLAVWLIHIVDEPTHKYIVYILARHI